MNLFDTIANELLTSTLKVEQYEITIEELTLSDQKILVESSVDTSVRGDAFLSAVNDIIDRRVTIKGQKQKPTELLDMRHRALILLTWRSFIDDEFTHTDGTVYSLKSIISNIVGAINTSNHSAVDTFEHKLKKSTIEIVCTLPNLKKDVEWLKYTTGRIQDFQETSDENINNVRNWIGTTYVTELAKYITCISVQASDDTTISAIQPTVDFEVRDYIQSLSRLPASVFSGVVNFITTRKEPIQTNITKSGVAIPLDSSLFSLA